MLIQAFFVKLAWIKFSSDKHCHDL